MSDERLREAERRWKESGTVEDEARYLQERVRAGTLHKEKLVLAANCQHRAAQIALGAGSLAAPDKIEDLIAGLGRENKEALVVACIAAANHCLSVVQVESSAQETLVAGLGIAAQWVKCQCVEHALIADRARSTVDTLCDIDALDIGAPIPPLWWLCTIVSGALSTPTDGWLHNHPTPSGSRCLEAFRVSDAETVRRVIREALVDWALRGKLPRP